VIELPDDMRVPLHSLQADLDWLIARVRAENDEVVSLCKESIRNRLSQIEEAAYRMITCRQAVTDDEIDALAKALRDWAGRYEEGSFDTEADLMGNAADMLLALKARAMIAEAQRADDLLAIEAWRISCESAEARAEAAEKRTS
jgi:hypothetical protein